jgi:5,5'-dehydrodivanillate O-demethylase
MPAGFIRFQERPQSGLIQKYQSWYVPIDDAHTMRFQVGFAPLTKNGKRYPWPAREHPIQPGPENDYFRNYGAVDTISGIPVDAPGTSVKGFLVQDNMANETQGAIVDRNREHLGAHDKVLAAMRTMLLIAFEDVRSGRDPRHIIRDPNQNEMVQIGYNEERELLGAL